MLVGSDFLESKYLGRAFVPYLRLNQTCQYFHNMTNNLSTCNSRRIFFSSSNSDSNCLISFLLKELKKKKKGLEWKLLNN